MGNGYAFIKKTMQPEDWKELIPAVGPHNEVNADFMQKRRGQGRRGTKESAEADVASPISQLSQLQAQRQQRIVLKERAQGTGTGKQAKPKTSPKKDGGNEFAGAGHHAPHHLMPRSNSSASHSRSESLPSNQSQS